jgi:DNA repair exonuclease SbcCD nuclease subunit
VIKMGDCDNCEKPKVCPDDCGYFQDCEGALNYEKLRKAELMNENAALKLELETEEVRGHDLAEENTELLKEIAELKGLLTVECIRGNDLAETIKFKDIEISKLHQRLMKE